MNDGVRVVIAVAAAILVIVLIVDARGPTHHRGDQVGSHGTKIVVVVPAPA